MIDAVPVKEFEKYREMYVQNIYRKLSNMSLTKSQNLNVSHHGLELSLNNILKPSVSWRMKM